MTISKYGNFSTMLKKKAMLQVAWDKHSVQLGKSKEPATAFSMSSVLTGATPPENQQCCLSSLKQWKWHHWAATYPEKNYLHFFYQIFPHSPSKLNTTPTKRFVVRARVNPLSIFSETVLEVYTVRVKSNFMHLIMNTTHPKVNMASLIWDRKGSTTVGRNVFDNVFVLQMNSKFYQLILTALTHYKQPLSLVWFI